jgi:FKBP-type peptidyl-prolyl cis-trans isomerase
LFAKQGWIFTDDVGEGKDGLPQSHRFTVGAGEVIRGLEIGVLGMKEGGVRRVVCPPGVSYQDKEQQPVPRDFSNRQRLYTTIFNPTRLANGEGDTLSTVIFDIELVRVAK